MIRDFRSPRSYSLNMDPFIILLFYHYYHCFIKFCYCVYFEKLYFSTKKELYNNKINQLKRKDEER